MAGQGFVGWRWHGEMSPPGSARPRMSGDPGCLVLGRTSGNPPSASGWWDALRYSRPTCVFAPRRNGMSDEWVRVCTRDELLPGEFKVVWDGDTASAVYNL